MSYFHENDIEVLPGNLYPGIAFNERLSATMQGPSSPSSPSKFTILPCRDPLKVGSVAPVRFLAWSVLCSPVTLVNSVCHWVQWVSVLLQSSQTPIHVSFTGLVGFI